MHLAESQRCRLHFIDMLSLHYRFQLSMLSVWGSKIFFLGTLITWHRWAYSKRIYHTCSGGQRGGSLFQALR